MAAIPMKINVTVFGAILYFLGYFQGRSPVASLFNWDIFAIAFSSNVIAKPFVFMILANWCK